MKGFPPVELLSGKNQKRLLKVEQNEKAKKNSHQVHQKEAIASAIVSFLFEEGLKGRKKKHPLFSECFRKSISYGYFAIFYKTARDRHLDEFIGVNNVCIHKHLDEIDKSEDAADTDPASEKLEDTFL